MNHNLELTTINTLAMLTQLAPEWNQLLSRCPRATPFQRPEWLLPWIEAFHTRQLRVVEVRNGGELVGLAPMFAYKSGDERVLAPIGAGISDYLDWPILPDYEPAAIPQILACFENMRDPAWERMDLLDLPPGSPLRNLAFASWRSEHAVHDVCPVLQLPPTLAELSKVIPKRQRRNLRTARNRILRAGNVEIEVATRATLHEFLEALLQLHTTRWNEAGTSGVLAEETVKTFHRRAAPLLLDAGVLRLYGLRLDRNLIATLHTFWEREAVYLYLQGFHPAYGEFSPGMQIVAAVIQDAVREGKKMIDFLRGRENYKYVWGANDQPTFRVVLQRQTAATDLSLQQADAT